MIIYFTGGGFIILGLRKSGIGGGFFTFLFSFSQAFINSNISSSFGCIGSKISGP